MNRRLLIDCDDCLIIWPEAHAGDFPLSMDEKPNPNEQLVEAVKKWRKHNPGSLVVVWSGGGRQYAQTWADKFLFGIADFAMAKTDDFVRDDDIVVDDEPFKSPGLWLTPRVFAEMVAATYP